MLGHNYFTFVKKSFDSTYSMYCLSVTIKIGYANSLSYRGKSGLQQQFSFPKSTAHVHVTKVTSDDFIVMT